MSPPRVGGKALFRDQVLFKQLHPPQVHIHNQHLSNPHWSLQVVVQTGFWPWSSGCNLQQQRYWPPAQPGGAAVWLLGGCEGQHHQIPDLQTPVPTQPGAQSGSRGREEPGALHTRMGVTSEGLHVYILVWNALKEFSHTTIFNFNSTLHLPLSLIIRWS